MSEEHIQLLGLTLTELSDFCESIEQPRYRGKQIYEWLYGRGITGFGEMTNLGKQFREHLAHVADIRGVRLSAQQESATDGTTKYLFELADGLKVESVLIPPLSAFRGSEATTEDEQTRLTLCISSQAGCPLDCKFCATATMGFQRNLSAGEIVDQVLHVKRMGKRITNVVFMGMGEPLMNYDNVMKAVQILSTGVGIAAKRMTVSTAGWADRIRQMGEERQRVKLAVSLHAADNALRSRLMPLNRKFNLESLLSAIEYYYRCTKQRITYEHIFFDGVNDTDLQVEKLLRLARKVPCKINVIPFHSIAFTAPSGFSASLRPSPRVEEIVQYLRERHLTIMVRSNAGEDIDAACGQLAVKASRRRTHERRLRPSVHVRTSQSVLK